MRQHDCVCRWKRCLFLCWLASFIFLFNQQRDWWLSGGHIRLGASVYSGFSPEMLRQNDGTSPETPPVDTFPENSLDTILAHEKLTGQGDQDLVRLDEFLRASEENTSDVEDWQPWCDQNSLNLTGRIASKKEIRTLEEIVESYPYVERGGRIRPVNCSAKERVAIIIPYRNRLVHLCQLLDHLIPFLHRQMVDATFFVVEQVPATTFNRGALFNVGFKESLKLARFDCFIFHDVDMAPSHDHNIYRCAEDNPVHLITGINLRKLPYKDYYGGVVAFTTGQYKDINGHSNLFFGWGGEDDDLLTRCVAKGYKLVRRSGPTGQYISFSHKRDQNNNPNQDRFNLIRNSRLRQLKDGLNSVVYSLLVTELQPLFTRFFVDVNLKALAENAPEYIQNIIPHTLKQASTESPLAATHRRRSRLRRKRTRHPNNKNRHPNNKTQLPSDRTQLPDNRTELPIKKTQLPENRT